MSRLVLLALLATVATGQLFVPPQTWPASHQLAYLGIPWNQGGKVKITVINTDGSIATNANVPFNPNPLVLHKSTETSEKYVIINRELGPGTVISHNGEVIYGAEASEAPKKE